MKSYRYGCSHNCQCGSVLDPIIVGGGEDTHTIDWVSNDLSLLEDKVLKFLNKKGDDVVIDRTHHLRDRFASVGEGTITTVFVNSDECVVAVIFYCAHRPKVVK